MVERAGGDQADVFDLKHVVGVGSVHLATAAGGWKGGVFAALVGATVLECESCLQINQRVVDGLVLAC